MTDFDALPWHDTRLVSIHIDRSDAGHRDAVHLRVQWPDATGATLVFTDVYSARFELNFGVIANEALCGRAGSTIAMSSRDCVIFGGPSEWLSRI